MILSRTPLRISLGGDGTDLPPYYTQHGGFGGFFVFCCSNGCEARLCSALTAAGLTSIDLAHSCIIGDSFDDLRAGWSVGCRDTQLIPQCLLGSRSHFCAPADTGPGAGLF